MDPEQEKVVEGVLKKELRSIAKAITLVEERHPSALELLERLIPYTGRAVCVGVVGPLGTGKSSLIDRLIRRYRDEGKSVAVLAVDPTSPVSGGALLGDRVRMGQHSLDSGVFIRSMASRGKLGGVSKATNSGIRILDAAGYDLILVETVGAGQGDIDISSTADLVVVVLMPQLGDQIQTLKAGLLEVGDIYVVNKADLEGAELTASLLEVALRQEERRPVILKTVATKNEGIDALAEAILVIYAHLKDTGQLLERKRNRAQKEILELVTEELQATIISELKTSSKYEEAVEKVLKKSWDPYTAAKNLLDELFKGRLGA